ncbi:hypothetical protein DFH06DRAFT_1325616 [Mycena polygramma]|nr:hypothetical protein DFH06DRAFT_1325616 [Mycena polygramma]
MHESLDLRNLANIESIRLRRVANAVVAGSQDDLYFLNELITVRPPAEAALFLPALFVNVDSARIPDRNTLDALVSSSSHIPSVYLGVESIHAITRLALIRVLPANAFQDLWPHIWSWLDFIHTYWDYLPMLGDRASQRKAAVRHAIIICALDKDKETSVTIRSTPGVRRLLAAAWKEKISGELRFSRDSLRFNGPFHAIGGLLAIVADGNDKESNFDEILEGVGGNITDLASTMVQHLARVEHSASAFTDPPHALDPHIATIFVGGCFSFWIGNPEIRCRLTAALQSVGYIPRLITTIFNLLDTIGIGKALGMCIYEVTMVLETIPSIALAFDSGLLRVVITIAASLTAAHKDTYSHGGVYKLIAEMLEVVIPWALMHHTVLAQLKLCFPDTMEFAGRSAIHTSAFRTQWENLSALMRLRLGFFDFWEANERPVLAACDNMICQKIDLKRKFKRCAACHSVNYCSEECQSADWRAEHRAMCQQLRSARTVPDGLTTRDRSFLRALLTRDYRL